MSDQAADIAALQVEVKHLTGKLESMEEILQAQTKQLTEIAITLATAKGGYKTVMLIGGAGATFGGLLVAIWQAFTGAGIHP